MDLADHEHLKAARAIYVVAARAAVARRAAGNPSEHAEPALVEGRGAGHLLRLPPDPVDLADHEHLQRLNAAGVDCVAAARAAVARRRAGHRADPGVPALVEGCGAGHLLRLPRYSVDLADHERLQVTGAVLVLTACAAVARRRAGHRVDRGVPALVESCGAGDFLRH